MTYGDGLSNTNISETINFHKSHGKMVTMTAVYPPGRFGALNIDENGMVTSFIEKPKGDGGMINGGYFVLSPKVIDYIKGDETTWENEPLEQLSKNHQVQAYKHNGFWQPMDTLRDKRLHEDLWKNNSAPWRV
jgi:glucose-1-phosphate cytidylyltransferase